MEEGSRAFLSPDVREGAVQTLMLLRKFAEQHTVWPQLPGCIRHAVTSLLFQREVLPVVAVRLVGSQEPLQPSHVRGDGGSKLTIMTEEGVH